ncbi:TetR family transcriptional regulator C-terminal domain-containing protein [Streptomyces sp. NPDC058832]|uniref:TetR family transcriptional regulator C-terminal domain-containing protein n=1 Tax=Streptomyces sp. NPDC058832 TaxID=3346646 RepID=UPI00369B44A8
MLWIGGWAAVLREPALRKAAQDLDQQWKAAIAEIVEEGAAAGESVRDRPADAAWRITAFPDEPRRRATTPDGLGAVADALTGRPSDRTGTSSRWNGHIDGAVPRAATGADADAEVGA